MISKTKLQVIYCYSKNVSLYEIEAYGDKNATTSTAFFKKGEYFKNKKFLLNLSDLFFVFFRIESILSKTFLKNTISILNIYLNPFVSNVPFLSPPNTSENLMVLWCFLGVEKGCTGNKWVNHLKYVLDK